VNSKQIERSARKDLKKIEPPLLEQVSVEEIYLLDDDKNRIRRVCGWEGCLNHPGKGTYHDGVGRCSAHDFVDHGKMDYIKRMASFLETNSKLKTQLEYYSKVPIKFTTQDLQNMLGLLLTNLMERYQQDLNDAGTFKMLEILKEIRQTLETQSKIEQNKMVTTAISVYINTILATVYDHVPKEKFNIILDKISNTPLPEEIENIEFIEV